MASKRVFVSQIDIVSFEIPVGSSYLLGLTVDYNSIIENKTAYAFIYHIERNSYKKKRNGSHFQMEKYFLYMMFM